MNETDRQALEQILNANGYTVAVAPLGGLADGPDSLCYAFSGRPPQILVVDLTAPATVRAGTLPLRHIQRIQKETWGEDSDTLPLIAFLSEAHLTQRDWLAFVDDFLVCSPTPDELLARIRLLMFRRQHVENSGIITLHDLTLDMVSCRATDAASQPLPLTPREFDLLRFLLTHRGKLFSRERLLDLVWGIDYEGGARTVDIHIRRLRAKLPPRAATCLETRRGVGYGFLPNGASGES